MSKAQKEQAAEELREHINEILDGDVYVIELEMDPQARREYSLITDESVVFLDRVAIDASVVSEKGKFDISIERGPP